MKLKQITLLLVVSGIYTSVSAQSTVYKCESSQGIVSYLNEPQSGYNCQKTELGSIKNMAMIKNEGAKLINFLFKLKISVAHLWY